MAPKPEQGNYSNIVGFVAAAAVAAVVAANTVVALAAGLRAVAEASVVGYPVFVVDTIAAVWRSCHTDQPWQTKQTKPL